jgi:hypothetical protein
MIYIIVLITLCILLYVWASRDPFHGFWKADPRFLADSKLTSMLFYFGPTKGGSRECVLYAANASGIILNKSTTVRFSGFGKKRKVYIHDVDYPWFPGEQIMWFDANKRCMVWTTDDPKITAKLYYDNCLSDVCVDVDAIDTEAGANVDNANTADSAGDGNAVDANTDSDSDSESDLPSM